MGMVLQKCDYEMSVKLGGRVSTNGDPQKRGWFEKGGLYPSTDYGSVHLIILRATNGHGDLFSWWTSNFELGSDLTLFSNSTRESRKGNVRICWNVAWGYFRGRSLKKICFNSMCYNFDPQNMTLPSSLDLIVLDIFQFLFLMKEMKEKM